MKNLNKALLSTAVLAALSAGKAYAGTEACFEVYKADPAVQIVAHETLYTKASCVAEEDRGGASGVDLAATTAVSVAAELTAALEVEFADVNDDDEALQIVYIPTTDIPGGTKITVKLAGAKFNGNSNQIHLVKADLGDDAAIGGAGAAADTIEAVASTDGKVDGEQEIVFVTKAGITIGAGTRLAFSRVSTGALAGGVAPVGIIFEEDACVDSSTTKSVTIAATEARTDGGTGLIIAGGKSGDQQVVDASAQFVTFVGSSTVEGQVNAESVDFDGEAITARTEFVYDEADNEGLILRKHELIHKAGFVNRGAALDIAVTLDADHELDLKFVESADAGSSVKAGLYNGRDTTGPRGQIDINAASATSSFAAFNATKPSDVDASVLASTVFAAQVSGGNAETIPAGYPVGSTYNELFFTVSQTDPTKIMNFNYDINVYGTLNFNDEDAYLNHCEVNKKTHSVGVNGAVLKVPYTVNGSGNFVRITNEHGVAAEVTADLFSESADGTTGNRSVQAVKLANIPAKSSVVYYVPDVVQAAVDQKNYAGSDGVTTNGANLRHTMTFTVTSPKNTVHGVSVQKLSTGQDRVMPVLDLNDWQQ